MPSISERRYKREELEIHGKYSHPKQCHTRNTNEFIALRVCDILLSNVFPFGARPLYRSLPPLVETFTDRRHSSKSLLYAYFSHFRLDSRVRRRVSSATEHANVPDTTQN